ncbi:unnamed protein product [Sympodiomycopsis kandeliae]
MTLSFIPAPLLLFTCSLCLLVLHLQVALAIPNYRPPEDTLASLPHEWFRGLPSPEELVALDEHLIKRSWQQGSETRASASLLQSCLLSSKFEIVSSSLNSTEEFWDAAQSDNLHFHWHPVAIVYPKTVQEVSQAVTCATQHGNTAVSPRSGGHSFVGSAGGGQDGNLIIDMKHFDHIRPSADGKFVDIGPGARLGDVVKGLWKDGKEKGMPHGTCPPVGVGGHALCGGFGPTSRRWGMTTDVITEAQIVLADGSIVEANSQGNQKELLWGLKGAGHNFGIVTNFRFKIFDASGPQTFFEYRWSPSLKGGQEMSQIVMAAQDFARDNLPAEIGFHLQLQPWSNSDPAGGLISMHMRGMYGGELKHYQDQVITKFWKYIAKYKAPKPDATREEAMTYLQMMEEWDDFGKPGDKLDTIAERLHRDNFIARTSIAMGQKGFTADTLKDTLQVFYDKQLQLNKEEGLKTWSWNTYLEMYGGSNARHRDADIVEKSSFPHRDGLWLIQSSIGTWGAQSFNTKATKWINTMDNLWVSSITKDKMERRAFTCYADSHLSESQWKELYFGGETLKRLTKLKEKVDPFNLFRNAQSLSGSQSRAPKAAGEAFTQAYLEGVHPLP